MKAGGNCELAINKLTEVCDHISPHESFSKFGFLGMIGIWNATSQYSWKKVTSTYQIDAGNGLVIVQLRELPSMDPIIDFDPLPTSASA
jgi:hypothetical protein